jgi:hypothetical protein
LTNFDIACGVLPRGFMPMARTGDERRVFNHLVHRLAQAIDRILRCAGWNGERVPKVATMPSPCSWKVGASGT